MEHFFTELFLCFLSSASRSKLTIFLFLGNIYFAGKFSLDFLHFHTYRKNICRSEHSSMIINVDLTCSVLIFHRFSKLLPSALAGHQVHTKRHSLTFITVPGYYTLEITVTTWLPSPRGGNSTTPINLMGQQFKISSTVNRHRSLWIIKWINPHCACVRLQAAKWN